MKFDIYNSISDIAPEIWQEDLCANDFYMQHSFIDVMERTIDDIDNYFHVIISENGKKLAAMSFFVYTVDFANLSTGSLRSAINYTQKVWKKAGKIRLLFGGLPLSTCNSAIRIFNESKAEAIMALKARIIKQIVKQNPVSLVALKEFDESERKHIDHLLQSKFNIASSLPTNNFTIQWDEFEDYRKSLNKKYRQALGYALKKRDELIITTYNNWEKHYDNECQSLYETINAEADFQIEKLSIDFFKETSICFGNNSTLIRAEVDYKTVGCLTFIETPDTIIALFVGFDKMLNRDYHIYFNLVYKLLEIAMEKKKKNIKFGQTADFFKQKLGCTPQDLWFYFWSPSVIINQLAKIFMPKLLPQAEKLNLNVFKNELK